MIASSIPIVETIRESTVVKQFKAPPDSEELLTITACGTSPGHDKPCCLLSFSRERTRQRSHISYEEAPISSKNSRNMRRHAKRKPYRTATYRLRQDHSSHLQVYTYTTKMERYPLGDYTKGRWQLW